MSDQLQSGTVLLSDAELRKRLSSRDAKTRLIVTPLLSERIEGGTIDVRLGTKFITGRRTQQTRLDPISITAGEALGLQERHEIAFWESFVVHPNHLVLASTLEYFSLPPDLSASVIARSSYGRSGLIAATAIHVHAGYKGCLTLELLNLGDVPIVLQPGLRIAQLVFSKHGQASSVSPGKYSLATGPEYPRLWSDETDRKILQRLAAGRGSV
jgi:dCTP deaminase